MVRGDLVMLFIGTTAALTALPLTPSFQDQLFKYFDLPPVLGNFGIRIEFNQKKLARHQIAPM